MESTRFLLEVRPRIPTALNRLDDLANDLLYGWDRDVRRLFRLLDNALYERSGGNLKVLLRRVAQSRLDAAAGEPAFLDAYQRVVAAYDAYTSRRPVAEVEPLCAAGGCVAYFCFEFGLHESLPLYSGGLGILAGDYCKAASDLALPVTAVGLMYRMGYFRQQIDALGEQIADYVESNFDELPATVVRADDGAELRVRVPIGADCCELRVWRVRAGNTTLLLLDADIDDNGPSLRGVTHQLYGGDVVTRVRQEMVLGIGGVRALRALGIDPVVWHLNEGHAAFGIVERCGEFLALGWTPAAAIEAVAASTIFTTHTPVAAGHDLFDAGLVETELGSYLDALGIDMDWLLDLGRNGCDPCLNMTTLAIRGSRYRNGVSRIHGRIAAATERHAWPEITPDENPLTFVTNGVHLPTFVALDWIHLFDTRFTDWRSKLADEEFWSCIDDIPDHRFWSLRQDLKVQLLAEVKRRIVAQHQRNGTAWATTQRVIGRLGGAGDVLVLGFARRFATYKRALLLFNDGERMARLLSDETRPVVLVMAGKAHPHDEPGRALIREVYERAMSPELIGKLVLVEDYDLALARLLVAGADVWINTPEYPLEASGTSGIKAAMNGAINLSVLDGWWAEAFDGTNGWAVAPHDPGMSAEYRDREEAKDLLDLLEREVLPSYFGRHDSDAWVRRAKASMRTIIPRFNSERMALEYVRRFYLPAAQRAARLTRANGVEAQAFALWKQRVAEFWEETFLRFAGPAPAVLVDGEPLELAVDAGLRGLTPADVRIECLLGTADPSEPAVSFAFAAADAIGDGVWRFTVSLRPPFPGLQHYRVRMYPHHELLAHPLEMGRMRWVAANPE
ncbi:MAG: alpha-glucan family phosphorylase [Pseudomonadales bacterium]